MKKLVIILCAGMAVLTMLGGLVLVINNFNNSNATKIASDYHHQNNSFQIRDGDTNKYRPYSDINSDWLQNALNVYNTSQSRKGPSLTIEDVQNFLKNQFDDDGKEITFETKGYNNIANYVNWYWNDNNDDSIMKIKKYELNQIFKNYTKAHTGYANKTYDDLSDDQKTAVNHKIYYPNYNLDLDNPNAWQEDLSSTTS